MASVPVPAVFVPTSDPRLFPSAEDLEAARIKAREENLPPSRPVLYTTVGDDPPANAGCLGKCDARDCECLYFAGKGGTCARCNHANLYHRVKIRRVDLEAKMAADALKRQKHRRHIPTQRELEEAKEAEVNKPPEPVNTYPCDVMDCECKRMLQPIGWDSALPFPKLCRGCKHAEMYHVKRRKDDPKNKKGGKSLTGKKGSKPGSAASGRGASASASAAASARNTGRQQSASAKKASKKK